MTFEQALNQLSEDRLLYFFVPIFLLSLALEYRYARKHQLEIFETRDTRASLWMMLFTPIVEFFPKLLAFIAFFYLHEISPLRDVVLRQWWAWLLLLFLDDFVYYWFHRMNHEVRLLWAGHVSHHSAVRMNFATALRQGVGERLHKFFLAAAAPAWF